ncbi:MAG: hypothetical protein IPK32_06005 [Verrucomicrobiaceae bacterium]|nr:hypothetical protein [Verrucomicrobiaceae bacterium]
MGQDRIDEILEQKRKKADKPADGSLQPDGDKFFSILVGESMQEHFLELQFSTGLQTCFSYTDLIWFNHDPESGCIDLAFGGFLVTIKGRGLQPLFTGIKQKRVAWVKEADSEMQDHKGNDCFVEGIEINWPKDFVEEATTETPQE